jgi:hypothetical protein
VTFYRSGFANAEDCAVTIFVHDGLEKVPDWPLACGTFVEDYDAPLMGRIASRFRNRGERQGEDIWRPITQMNAEFADYLRSGRLMEAAAMLGGLFASNLSYGFEQHSGAYMAFRGRPENLRHPRLLAVDRLLSLAEAVGAIPVQNAEQGDFEPYLRMEPDTLLSLIEGKTGIVIQAPAVVPGLFGLATDRGIFTDRTLTALYVALRARSLFCTGAGEDAICEIGGGAGYVAYWLRRLGAKGLTICDLPMVSAIQEYFLAKNEIEGVALVGSDELELNTYKGFINVDSFPEINGLALRRYITHIKACGGVLLSINQEACAPRGDGGHQERVGDVVAEIGGFCRSLRAPFFMRRGYVEEVYDAGKLRRPRAP